MENQLTASNLSLEKIITAAIQIPGVKVDRNAFLRETFRHKSETQQIAILKSGPVQTGCPRAELKKIARALVEKRTLASSGASFVAGIPGGLAIAAAIPADLLQFYAISLRMAQEIAYIYGESDLWEDGHVNENRVTAQLILYCGVMLGASGAAAGVRALAAALAQQALVQLPKQALSQKMVFQISAHIAKVIGVKMTKGLFVKGVSKIIPVVGGALSGSITYVSMRPMGYRLINTFDQVRFDYSAEKFEADCEVVSSVILADQQNTKATPAPDVNVPAPSAPSSIQPTSAGDIIQILRELKALLDEGVITEEEFTALKTSVITGIQT